MKIKLQKTSKRISGFDQEIIFFMETFGLDKENAFNLLSNCLFHGDVQRELYQAVEYEYKEERVKARKEGKEKNEN